MNLEVNWDQGKPEAKYTAPIFWLPVEQITFRVLFLLGLGDYVPQNTHHTVFFGGYIIVGLVLVIMLFSAMEEEIAQWFDKIKQMVGSIEHAQEAKKDL